jgi:xanthine/CO dehydrogenase XdhC/CoxF family maturation factor
MSDLLARLKSSPPQRAVLATLVNVVGSAYRRPGAAMVLFADGTAAGGISAGCLESDVRAHAEKVMVAGAPTVLHYDLGQDDPLWGLGMGCKADIDVLLEPLPAGTLPPHLTFAARLRAERRYGVVATVFTSEGAAPPLASRLWRAERADEAYEADGGDVPPGPAREAIRAAATHALAERRSTVDEQRGPWGRVAVFYDVVIPPIALLACGAADALPLVRLAAELGWTATLVEGDAQHSGLDAAPAPDARTAAVVMTHRYERDRALLAELLPSPAGYIGILGPRARTAQLLDDLRREGIVPTEAQLARLFAPVGLDVGAESPEEVALAIAGEVMAVMAGREGGLLRARKGAIHS